MRASNPELARVKALVKGFLLIAACMLAAAFLTWRDPPLPPYEGRWSWVADLTYLALGGTGLALLWVAGAGLVLAAARFMWRHTPKTPQDRLF